MLWIHQDLTPSINSSNNLNLKDLTCRVRDGASESLLAKLSTLDCRTTTASPATIRPSSRSSTTTVTYLVQDEPATKKQTLLVNDSSASLQLSSPAESKDIKPKQPASTNPSKESSATKNGIFPFVSLSLSLFLVAMVTM